MARLPDNHKSIVDYLKSLGFTNVSYYDVDVEGVLYTGTSPSNVRAEIYLKVDTTGEAQWRALGVKHIEEVEWYDLGTFEPVTAQEPEPTIQPESHTGSEQLSLFEV